MMPSDPHPKLDVFELLSSRRPRHGLGMGLARAGSTCTDGLEGSPGRSDSHFRGGCGQQAARRALRFVRGRAGGYARARERAREKNRRGCAWRTTFSKRGVGFGATLAKTSCTWVSETSAGVAKTKEAKTKEAKGRTGRFASFRVFSRIKVLHASSHIVRRSTRSAHFPHVPRLTRDSRTLMPPSCPCRPGP